MASTECRANFILENIKSGEKAFSSVKKDVESIASVPPHVKLYGEECWQSTMITREFLLEANGQSWIAKSQFAIRCLHALATSATLRNKTNIKRDGSSRKFVAIVVLCHDYIFDRGHETSEEEESQIGRYLYSILFQIIEKDHYEAVIVSDLILKIFSRSYRMTPWPHVGSIVRNASILLWNSSLKPEHSPAEALRLRLNAMAHLSLARDSQCAIKFCDRALSSAQLYCSALDRNAGSEVRDLGQFTNSIFSLFHDRIVTALGDMPEAFENIVKLIHINANRHLKHGCLENISNFLTTVSVQFDAFGKITGNFSNCPRVLSLGVDVLALALLMIKITSKKSSVRKKSSVPADGKEFDRVTAYVVVLQTRNFTQFDKSCFAVAVNSLKIHFRSLIDIMCSNASIIHPLAPCFHQISKWIMSIAQCAASFTTTSGDSIYLLDHLSFYQVHHLKVVQHTNEQGLNTDLHVAVSTMKQYCASIANANNRNELFGAFVKRIFQLAFVLYEQNMYAQVVDIVQPHVALFVESFSQAKQSGAQSTENYWKQMAMFISCLKKSSKFREALQLIAAFLSKGHVEMDVRAIAAWAKVKQEARFQKVESVRAVTLSKLLTPLCASTTGSCKRRIATLLAEEITILYDQSCPVDEFNLTLCDLLKFTDDSSQAASALLQMARLLLGKETQCDAEGRTASDCCRRALDLLGDSVTPDRLRWFVVQAKFISCLDRLRRVYDALEAKVTNLRARQAQSLQEHKERVERTNAAAAAAEADGDVLQERDEIASFQPSSISEELESVTELDACLDCWTAMINSGQPEVTQYSSVLLKDLKLAAEIYCNARLYDREIVVRQLYVTLTEQRKMRTERLLGSCRLACTLTRLGLIDAAERVLHAADFHSSSDKSKDVSVQAFIRLELAYGELRLMQDRVIDGFDHLCRAIDLIQAEKRYTTMMMLHGRYLLLLGKYMELPLPNRPPGGPLQCTLDALRLFVGVLRSCAKEKDVQVESFNLELIGCLLDCGLQLSQRFYDVGLPRDARVYLKEQMAWSQQFFCVTRTAEVLLLSAKIDQAVGNECGCLTKLNAIRSIIDSIDRSGQQLPDKLRPASPLPLRQELWPTCSDAQDFLSEPTRSNRVLAKLQPASQLKSSPVLAKSLWSVDSRFADLTRYGHCRECECSWCGNIELLRIRTEFLMVNYRLAGKSPFSGLSDLQKVIKSLSMNEKKLLTKMSALEPSSSSALLKSPMSRIDVLTCCIFSRLAGDLLDAKDGNRALGLIDLATKMFSKIQVGVGQLSCLQATLLYQECLAVLLIEAKKKELGSVSKLCENAWSRSFIPDSVGIECLVSDFRKLTSDETVKTLPAQCFKTPKPKVLRAKMTNRNLGAWSSTAKKNVDCVAPIKKSVKSCYEYNFEGADVDIDEGCDKKEGSSECVVLPQPVTSSRRIIPTITISDKENSDIDDTMSPTGATKRKIKAVTITERSLRSKKKITIIDLDADRTSDDASSNNSSVQVMKTSKTTSKRGPKAKCLFGIPLEKSDRVTVTHAVPTDNQGVRKLRIRNKATTSASDLQQVEAFRVNSPVSTVKMVGWRTASKVPIDEAEYPDDDEDTAASEHEHFDMDDVIGRLEKALKLIEHYPRMPLYGELNLLLALCKGDGHTRKAKTELGNGLGHVLESVGVSFRHYADFRLTINTSISGSMQPKTEERRRILSCQEGCMLSRSNSDEEVQRLTDRLPKGWVVCQVNALPTPLSGNALNPHLIVTRLEHGRRPIMVKIENHHNGQGVRSFLSEFEDIMTESQDKMRISVKVDWWEVRKSLDARLRTFLSSMENTWLGAWKCLFLGRRLHSEDQKQLRDATHNVVHQLTSSLGIHSPDEDLVELLLDCWPQLKGQGDCWRRGVSRVCHFMDMSDDRMDKAFSVFDVQSARLWTIDEVRRHVCVLIVDKVLHHLPWENMPVLQQQPMTRVPSIHVLLAHLSFHLDRHVDENSVSKLPSVNGVNGYYVLNPSKDLVVTQGAFTSMFQEMKWLGVAGQPPTSEQWIDALSNKDLFVYCGHGSGCQYVTGEKIDRVTCRAVTILMGCSSALLRNEGTHFEPFGVIYNYLVAGCPYVMGNLWNVTDKDIDRFLAELLRLWMPGPSQKDDSITHALPLARIVPMLRSLIGAAPVAYGIPVYS